MKNYEENTSYNFQNGKEVITYEKKEKPLSPNEVRIIEQATSAATSGCAKGCAKGCLIATLALAAIGAIIAIAIWGLLYIFSVI